MMLTTIQLVFYKDSTYSSASQVGTVSMTNIPATVVSTSGSQTYIVQIDLSSTISVTSQPNLVNMIEQLLQNPAATMYTSGVASVQVNTSCYQSGSTWVTNSNYGFGPNSLVISNIGFKAGIPLTGYNSFAGKVTVGAINVVGGSAGALLFTTTMTLTGSPSLISTMGAFNMNMNLSSNSGYLGYTSVASGVVVPQGPATVSVATSGSLTSNSYTTTMLSNWLNSACLLAQMIRSLN